MHVEPDQVSDAMREEQRGGTPRVQILELAAEDAELDEPCEQATTCGTVHVQVASPGTDRGDSIELSGQNDIVDRALGRRKTAVCRPNARHVRRPALRCFGTDVRE